ncbi:hypothetical protein E2562_018458 [Oryza meyeriana var. granulata]|uniref:Uncharacterized protein n=1 Tax=Oryza meyeriana var. granulata TaxID=110450 RepID=A0A6G1EMF1_9ORYZ|nr:hypothetical protein E2562_018458 [Oryza meyeriana var. granulata]
MDKLDLPIVDVDNLALDPPAWLWTSSSRPTRCYRGRACCARSRRSCGFTRQHHGRGRCGSTRLRRGPTDVDVDELPTDDSRGSSMDELMDLYTAAMDKLMELAREEYK